jgi:hypothetical protein
MFMTLGIKLKTKLKKWKNIDCKMLINKKRIFKHKFASKDAVRKIHSF